MIKVLLCFLIFSSFLFAGDLTVKTLNEISGNLKSTATVTYKNLSQTSTVFTVDSNSVIVFNGFSGATTETAQTGTGFSDVSFTYNGNNTYQEEEVDVGANSYLLTTRTFDDNGDYLINTNSNPILTSGYGDFTIEILLYVSAITGTNRFWGHLKAGGSYGMQFYFDTASSGTLAGERVNSSGDLSVTYTGIQSAFTAGSWAHIVYSYDQGATTAKFAYKIDGIITDMSGTGGAGQPDAINTDASVGDTYSTAPVAWMIGHGYETSLGTDNTGLNGKIAAFRISNVVRY